MKIAVIAVFVLYGLPLWKLRYRWRATVYRMDSWKINVMPWFGHDVAALFTDRYFVNDDERRMARQFRWYLAGYVGLLALVLVL